MIIIIMELKIQQNINFNIIKDIYKPSGFSISFLMPIFIIGITVIITITYLIQINLNISKLDWDKNKCVPKYMFISGFIKKEENLGILGSTNKIFRECINKYK